MKTLINTIIAAATLTIAIASSASAMGIGQVKENYTSEAYATLSYAGLNASDYFVECRVAKDGEMAICNAITSIESLRASVSMVCGRVYSEGYGHDETQGYTKEFIGLSCVNRLSYEVEQPVDVDLRDYGQSSGSRYGG